MGLDLKGKELGKGLSQRKDGRYSARYRPKGGGRVEKYFKSLPEARNWLEDAKYRDKHETVLAPFGAVVNGIIETGKHLPTLSDMTVDEWFDFWYENVISDRAYNTRRNYRERYETNVKPVMGKLRMTDVRPFHCKKVFLEMDDEYAGSTIRQTYIQMGTMFKSALMNGIIQKHPMDGVEHKKPCKKNVRFLTVEEQQRFNEVAKRSHNKDPYDVIQDTGLRTSEWVGLTFGAINFKEKTITIDKTLEYRHKTGEWRAGSPKTKAGYRTIPITEKTYSILKRLYDNRHTRYEAEELNQVLSFKDRLTGEIRYLDMKDLVFVNYRTGMPTKNSSYDTHLYKLCEEAGIKPFSMHALRHTYATRCIERGVNYKALQELLGHGSLKVTMDTYVHVTDDSKVKAVRQFEGKALDENA